MKMDLFTIINQEQTGNYYSTREIDKIEKFLQVKGNTLIPLKLYISEKGWAKLDIACAQGKKLHDKRQDMKEKDAKMELNRLFKK
jgi:SsrA-binding protein